MSDPAELHDDFDWELLRVAAVEARGHAYAPYSSYPVGAAALVEDGRVVTGCNVENASYGLALCAECGLVSQLHLTGGGLLSHVAVVDRDGQALMPCGRCRQLLWENADPSTLVLSALGAKRLEELLPDAFGPGHL